MTSNCLTRVIVARRTHGEDGKISTTYGNHHRIGQIRTGQLNGSFNDHLSDILVVEGLLIDVDFSFDFGTLYALELV
jgi:hypothetical protein